MIRVPSAQRVLSQQPYTDLFALASSLINTLLAGLGAMALLFVLAMELPSATFQVVIIPIAIGYLVGQIVISAIEARRATMEETRERECLRHGICPECCRSEHVSMIRRLFLMLTALLAFGLAPVQVSAQTPPSKCTGKFVNPVTDICWSCIFPISLGGAKLWPGRPDTNNPDFPLCARAARRSRALGLRWGSGSPRAWSM